MRVTILTNKKISKSIINTLKKYKNIKYSKSKLQGIENYILVIFTDDDCHISCDTFFEMFDEIKSLLKQDENQFEILNNDFSEMFCRKLYPKFQKFELNLRKLLNIAFCDTSDKYKEALETLNSKLKPKKQNIVLKYSTLESSDLSDIFYILFSDKSFFAECNSMREKSFYTRNEIERIPDNNLWSTELSKFWPNFKLNEYCRELYNYRNDVMHFHNIDYCCYKKALKLINKANKEVLMALEKQIIIEPERIETNPAIVKTLADSINNQLEKYAPAILARIMILNQTKELSSSFNEYIKTNMKHHQDFYNLLQEQLNRDFFKRLDIEYIEFIRNLIIHFNTIDNFNRINNEEENNNINKKKDAD